MPGAVIAVIAVANHSCGSCSYYLLRLPLPYRKKVVEAKIGSAEEKAREIIDDALKTAETKKREALLEAKEESLKTKERSRERNPGDEEPSCSGMRSEFFPKKKLWTRKLMPSGEAGSRSSSQRRRTCVRRAAEIERASVKNDVQELERISGLTSEQAKEYLLKTVEDEVKHDTAKLDQRAGSQSKGRSRQESKGICGQLPFRNVRLIMWPRRQSLWYSFPMMR